jgi:hypothetical protein
MEVKKFTGVAIVQLNLTNRFLQLLPLFAQQKMSLQDVSVLKPTPHSTGKSKLVF